MGSDLIDRRALIRTQIRRAGEDSAAGVAGSNVAQSTRDCSILQRADAPAPTARGSSPPLWHPCVVVDHQALRTRRGRTRRGTCQITLETRCVGAKNTGSPSGRPCARRQVVPVVPPLLRPLIHIHTFANTRPTWIRLQERLGESLEPGPLIRSRGRIVVHAVNGFIGECVTVETSIGHLARGAGHPQQQRRALQPQYRDVVRVLGIHVERLVGSPRAYHDEAEPSLGQLGQSDRRKSLITSACAARGSARRSRSRLAAQPATLAPRRADPDDEASPGSCVQSDGGRRGDRPTDAASRP